jgi:ribonuclease Z
MRPSFCPRLVNGPFGDPGLYIPFGFQNRAIMFDLGDISALSSKNILKISHIFVTHTHMDHFTGFDRLLRLMIGRKKTLYLYGPQGFIDNVEGKLAGYTWNLVNNYTDSLTLEIVEIQADKIIRQRFACKDMFKGQRKSTHSPFRSRILEESDISIDTALLDHGIPCLGFTINERFHINILKNGLAAMKLRPGPWLQVFKNSIYEDVKPSFRIQAESENEGKYVSVQLSELIDKIAMITPGQKVCYVADVAYNKTNIERIVNLAENSDHLFIEAAFLDQHQVIAELKNHLTAKQAGSIAGWAQVKRVTPFHFSPRYTECKHLLEKETRQAYKEYFGTYAASLGRKV